jgi:superfamily II DNA/RNA helicase
LDIDLTESGAATPIASTEEQDVPAGIVQGVMGKLAQIMESIKENPHSSEHSYKVKLLVRLLKQSERAGDRVLVFSHSIATLNFLQRVLSRKKINFCRLDGQTQMGDRQAMMKEFNRGAWCVFLISTRAGGLGFNLPGANRVVLFDFHFNPTWEEQAIGRVYRLGQEKPVFVYRFFTGGTFEEELLNVAVFKIQLAYTVVEKKNIKSRAEKFAKWLVLPEPVHQEDLQDHKNKDEVLDRIIARSESEGKGGLYIRAIRTTETLQEEWDEILDDDDRLEIQNEIAREKSRLENPQGYRPFDSVTASALHALMPQGTPSLSFPPPLLPTNTHGQNKESIRTLRKSPNDSSDTLQTRVDNHLKSEFGKPLSYLRTTGLPDPLTARPSSSLTASTSGLPSLQNHQRTQPSGLTPLRTDAGHQRVFPPDGQAMTPQDSAQSTAQISSIPASQVNRTHSSKSYDSS